MMKHFLRASVVFVFLLNLHGSAVLGQRLTRDLRMGVLVNQAGYIPSASKKCVLQGSRANKIYVVEATSGDTAYSAGLVQKRGDFGEYAEADFSAVSKEGVYYIRADTLRSYPFTVSAKVYQPGINSIVHYFSKQRCGASTTGYLTPCHVDDGIRFDNGKHQDVTGGWHDASDLRKWVSATLYGVIGLANAYRLQPAESRKTILDELMWGNQYFLKMQEPDGYVMDFIGGDLKKHSDNNRWTDNEAAERKGKIELMKPNSGDSQQEMLTDGKSDDRIIQTQPVERSAQYNFVIAEAMMAAITDKDDAAYSKKCLAAATRCYEWCLKTAKADSTTELYGAALQAAVELYRATSSDKYKQHAIAFAARLKKLQAGEGKDVYGFFYTSATNNTPAKEIWRGCQGFIGLCDLVELFPAANESNTWRTMIRQYAENYLMTIADKNNFGIVPFGLFKDKDSGERKIGNYWYRYFMQPNPEWFVGINSNVASAGVGLLKAARVLKNNSLNAVAQRQLDWIIGYNTFNSSTLIGTGFNAPEHFPGTSFLPAVPVINGAVMNGLVGNEKDMPVIGKGHWQISEYWTPMVAYTLWLMSELTAYQPHGKDDGKEISGTHLAYLDYKSKIKD